MNIEQIANIHCESCDYDTPKPCLSCMKFIIYEAIKEAWIEQLNYIDFESIISQENK